MTAQQIVASSLCLDCIPQGLQPAAVNYLLALELGMSDPQTILTAARCFDCIPPGAQPQVMLYLLATRAGITSPAALVELAKCFECVPPGMQGAAMIGLLDTLATSCPQDMQWSWTPGSVDLGEQVGYSTTQNFSEAVTAVAFRGDKLRQGLTLNANSSLLTASFPNLTQTGIAGVSLGFSISSNTVLTSISAPLYTLQEGTNAGVAISSNPLLASVNFNSLQSIRGLTMTGNSALTSLSFPALSSVNNATLGISITAHTLLTILDLSALVTLGATMTMANCTSLANVSLNSYVPTNGRVHTFTNCALTAASVNQLLARCVANAGYVTGTINTSGGTSSAPTGQGIIDKATLILRGVTVTTN